MPRRRGTFTRCWADGLLTADVQRFVVLLVRDDDDELANAVPERAANDAASDDMLKGDKIRDTNVGRKGR